MDTKNAVITDITEVITVYSEKGRCTEMKNRRYYGLSICTEGRITYTHNGVSFVQDKNHPIFLPKGKSYSLHTDVGGVFRVINFELLVPMCETLSVIETQNSKYLMNRAEEMQRLSSSNAPRSKIMAIFYEILSELSSQNDGSEVIMPAVSYMRESYAESDIKNATLAEKCSISEVYFRKLFKKHFGISPKQYLLSLRLQNAALLLRSSNKKITAISAECGFESTVHFCRTFKAQVGLSPSEYRKRNQIYEI